MSDVAQESNNLPTEEYGEANPPSDPPLPESLREVLGAASEVTMADAISDAEDTAGMSGRAGGSNDQPYVGDLDEVHVGQTAAQDEERTWSEVVAELPVPGTTRDADAVNAMDTPYAYATSRATLDADTVPLTREVPADTESQLGNVPSLEDATASGGAPTETLTPGPGEDTAPLAPDAPEAMLDDLPNDADSSTVEESLRGTDAEDTGAVDSTSEPDASSSTEATTFAEDEDDDDATTSTETTTAETQATSADTDVEGDDDAAAASAEATTPAAQEMSADTDVEGDDRAVSSAEVTTTDAQATTSDPQATTSDTDADGAGSEAAPEALPTTADEIRAAANEDAMDGETSLGGIQVVVSSPSGMEQSSDPGNANPMSGGDAPIPQVTSEAEAGIESLPPALEMRLEGTSAQTDPQATAQMDPPLPLDAPAPEVVADVTGEPTASETASEGEGAPGEGGRRRRRRRGGSGRQGRKLDSFSAGEELQGTVRSIQTYGAFVDVGAERDGLVHISELKDGFVEKVEDVVKEGDSVTVRIKDVDVEKGRLSLTMRSAASQPQAAATTGDDGEPAPERAERAERGERTERGGGERAERGGRDRDQGGSTKTRLRDLAEGQEVTGTVTSIVEFGAFVDVGATTDGLIHISELSEDRVNRVNEVVQEGQQVTVRILSIDRKRNRISLSMRPQADPTEFEIEEEEGGEAIETPSAMELAFARARERNRKDEREEKRRADRERNNSIMDDIIARTLGQDNQ